MELKKPSWKTMVGQLRPSGPIYQYSLLNSGPLKETSARSAFNAARNTMKIKLTIGF